MTEIGTVQVDHHQFLLTTTDADPTDVTAEGALIWTGPGFVAVLTGIAYGPATVVLDISATNVELSAWEAVEETVIDAATDLRLMTLGGDVIAEFAPTPAGRYRVRVHARGRDAQWDLDVTEPTEHYLLQVSPTMDPTGGIEQLRKTDTAYDPPAKQVPEIDYEHVYVTGPDGDMIKVGRDSPEALAAYALRDKWGGRPPSGRIAADQGTYHTVSTVADLDRDLIDQIDALTPEQQRALARWCAHRAFERAGLTEFADFRTALHAMDNGTTPPPDFANASLLHHRLATDPNIPLTVIPGFAARSESIPQHTAITSYFYAVDHPDPLNAVFEAVRFTAYTYGQHYPELFHRIRTEFLAGID